MLRIELKGDKEIERELQRLSSIRFDAVVLKSMTQIYNRGKAGGTPVDTGELRMSLGQAGETVGYTASYAFRNCGAYKTGQKRRKLNFQEKTHVIRAEKRTIVLVMLNAYIQRLNRGKVRQASCRRRFSKSEKREKIPLLLEL